MYDPGYPIQFAFTAADYDPPDGNKLEFRLADFAQVCELFLPAVGQVDFDLVDPPPASLDFSFVDTCYPAVEPEEIVPKCEEVEPYSPPAGDAVVLHLYGLYDWPSGYVELDLADCAEEVEPEAPPEPEPWYVIPSAVSPGIRCMFDRAGTRDRKFRFSWNDTPVLDPVFRVCHRTPKEVDKLLRAGWGSLYRLYVENRVSFDRLARTDSKAQALWRYLNKMDVELESGWDALEETGKKVEALYNAPPPQDVACRAGYEAINRLDCDELAVVWGNPAPLDVGHRTMWGQETYARICLRDYIAPDGDAIDFDFDTAIENVGDQDHVSFWFESLSYDERCSQREPSGWRDAYTYIAPAIYPVTPMLGVYFRMNSASLIRVSDSVSIRAFSMAVQADIDSWCWRFSARIPAASLALVSPVSEPVEVLATINGYSWRIMVESWTESKGFNRKEYTISGRSTSAELAAPYAPIISGVNELATSVQIVEDQLFGTGWSIDFGDYSSWVVGAGAFSYSNSSALKVVQRVAEACGGRLLTHRSDSTLLVVPRLHSLPWTWGTATPDLGISDYVVKQLSREFLPGLSYNAVFVSGENQGVLCKVTRSGSAGDQIAPMVTDALITAVDPARERGRMILGRSGKWSRESMELPLTAPEDLPGLLDIGMLVSMTEGAEVWRGQVTGVSVAAGWESGRGLQVKQNIDVERYRGN